MDSATGSLTQGLSHHSELCPGLVHCPLAPGRVGSGVLRVTTVPLTASTGWRGQKLLPTPSPGVSILRFPPFPSQPGPGDGIAAFPLSQPRGLIPRWAEQPAHGFEGLFAEQTTPLPAYDGAWGTPLRLAKRYSQDWAFLLYWHWEVSKGPVTGDTALPFVAALGPLPAFQASAGPPSCLLFSL